MGLTIELQDEFGVAEVSLGDPENILRRVLPEAGDPRFRHLCWIYPWGDTTFNSIHASGLAAEFEELRAAQTDEKTIRILDQIVPLAERVRDEVHLYLKFIGD